MTDKVLFHNSANLYWGEYVKETNNAWLLFAHGDLEKPPISFDKWLMLKYNEGVKLIDMELKEIEDTINEARYRIKFLEELNDKAIQHKSKENQLFDYICQALSFAFGVSLSIGLIKLLT